MTTETEPASQPPSSTSGPRELQLEVRGLELAAVAWGPPDGWPALALHGWLDNAASFERLAPLLPGIRLVALDLPGHGRSEHLPQSASYHFIDWIPFVLDAVTALGWQRCSLIGHSMGAGIASMVPAVAGDRVHRLVLIEGAGPMVSPAHEAATALRKALEDEHQIRTRPPRRLTSIEAATMARMAGGSDLDAASTRILVQRSIVTAADGVRFGHDPRLKTRSRLRLTEEHARAFLSGISCPTLAIRARSGWPVPIELMRSRLALIKSLRTLEVDGGHHVHLTNPERLAPAILEHLLDRQTRAGEDQ